MINTENIVAKGEIAHHEKRILLPESLQKLSAADASESVYLWERVKVRLSLSTFVTIQNMFVMMHLIYQGPVKYIFIPLQY